MKTIHLGILKTKGVKAKSNTFDNRYAIQEQNIECSQYTIGNLPSLYNNSSLNSDSIYGFGLATKYNCTAYIPEELLDEVFKQGRKIYDSSIDNLLNSNKFFPDSLFEAIEQLDPRLLINIFFIWIKDYGFPIIPRKAIECMPNYLQEELAVYELTFKDIKNLSAQFLVIYMLYDFFQCLNQLKNSKNSLYYLEEIESDMYAIIEKNIEHVNNFNKLFGEKNLKISEDFLDIPPDRKYLVIKDFLKSAVIAFNLFSELFDHSSKKYFSFNNGNIYYQAIQSNIFDICWDLLAEKYNTFSMPTRKCSKCNSDIPAITNKKYCDNCAKELKPSSQTQYTKKLLLQEIIDFYYSVYLTEVGHNAKFEKVVIRYKNRLEGKAKDLEKEGKKKAEKIFEQMKKEVKGITLLL